MALSLAALPRTTLVRDLVILAVVALLWWCDARGLGGAGVSIAAGLSVAVAAFLLHEWGHLVGALAVGSHVYLPNRVLAPLLFHFDTERNDRRQFLWMSCAGYVTSALGPAVIAALAPLDRLSGRVALGVAVVALIGTLVAEAPMTLRVLRGEPLPKGHAFSVPAPPPS